MNGECIQFKIHVQLPSFHTETTVTIGIMEDVCTIHVLCIERDSRCTIHVLCIERDSRCTHVLLEMSGNDKSTCVYNTG